MQRVREGDCCLRRQGREFKFLDGYIYCVCGKHTSQPCYLFINRRTLSAILVSAKRVYHNDVLE